MNGVLYDKASDWQPPGSSVSVEAGYPGSMPPAMTAVPLQSASPDDAATTTVDVPTGVYVATATPSTSHNGSPSRGVAWDLNVLLCSFAMTMATTYLW